ncbi:MAG: sigma-70 family RNA polymerase sigma factor, partial [Oligoflexia bacterium]|nr:sigma-70 family RNA polymerase sigma factor [Oligoflexia bacterium]
LAVRQKDVLEMTTRLSGGAEFSIDQPLGNTEDGETTFLSTHQDNTNRPDIIVEEKDAQEYLRNRLEEFAVTLNEKEKVILKERLLSEAPKTLQEIADSFGISKERTRQLESRILQRLKDNLSDLDPG